MGIDRRRKSTIKESKVLTETIVGTDKVVMMEERFNKREYNDK